MESQRSSDSRKQEGVASHANWSHWPRRAAVYAAGTVIVVAGIVILPLPGPMGTPIILIGLTVLARESPRAERIRARMVEALRLKQLAEARPKRFRLHLSTVVALTVTAGALIGANAVEGYYPVAYGWMGSEHGFGWPVRAGTIYPTISGRDYEFEWKGCTINAMVSLAILVLVALPMEWLTRRRRTRR